MLITVATPALAVAVSFNATGSLLAPVIVTVTVAVSVPPLPSET